MTVNKNPVGKIIKSVALGAALMATVPESVKYNQYKWKISTQDCVPAGSVPTIAQRAEAKDISAGAKKGAGADILPQCPPHYLNYSSKEKGTDALHHYYLVDFTTGKGMSPDSSHPATPYGGYDPKTEYRMSGEGGYWVKALKLFSTSHASRLERNWNEILQPIPLR